MFTRSLVHALAEAMKRRLPVFQALAGPRQAGKMTMAQQVMGILSYPSVYATADGPLPPQEVILVDSSSTDNSFQLINDWIKKNSAASGITFHNLRKGINLPSSSTNAGIRHATGEVLAFVDCGLLFEKNWLEKQLAFMESGKFDFVSGVCYFEGVSLLDCSAIALTYGYKRTRPAIPSSLIRRTVFDKVGLLYENIRAGYDIDFIYRVGRQNIRRGINSEVIVRYNGANYASSAAGLFKKMAVYSEPLLKIQGYYYPFFYLALSAAFLPFMLFCTRQAIVSFLLYLAVRGYGSAAIKSGSLRLFIEKPLSLLSLPFVGLLIDSGKVTGYAKGVIKKFLKNEQPAF